MKNAFRNWRKAGRKDLRSDNLKCQNNIGPE